MAAAIEVCLENYAMNLAKGMSDLKEQMEKVTERKQAVESAAKLSEDKHKNLKKWQEDEKINRKGAEKSAYQLHKKVEDLSEQLNRANSWEEQKKAAIETGAPMSIMMSWLHNLSSGIGGRPTKPV